MLLRSLLRTALVSALVLPAVSSCFLMGSTDDGPPQELIGILALYSLPYNRANYQGVACTAASGPCSPLASIVFTADIFAGSKFFPGTQSAATGADGSFNLTDAYSSAITGATRLNLHTSTRDHDLFLTVGRCGINGLCVVSVDSAATVAMGVSDLRITLSKPASTTCAESGCSSED